MRLPARRPTGLLPIAALAVLAGGYLFVRDLPLVQDEIVHANQVRRFIRGQLQVDADLTTLPGYHAVLAAAGRLAGDSSTAFLRAVQALISLASIAAFHRLAARLGHEASWTSLQYLSLPPLFPFFFLLYTDVLALLVLLVAFWLAAAGRVRWAGFAGSLGMLVRQTNAVWLALLCAFVFFHRHRGKPRREALRAWLSECSVALAGLGLFALFVVRNRGVAVGDQTAHPAVGVHLTNAWLLLALAAVVLFPVQLAATARWARTRERWWPELLWLGAALALYWVSFTNSHPYNARASEYLRNALLVWATSSAAAKAALFLPIAWTLVSLRADPPPGGMGAALGAATLGLLAFTWLVEPRYYVVPLSLFLLFRVQREAWADRTLVAINAPLALLLLWGIRTGRFFP